MEYQDIELAQDYICTLTVSCYQSHSILLSICQPSSEILWRRVMHSTYEVSDLETASYINRLCFRECAGLYVSQTAFCHADGLALDRRESPST